MKFSIIMPVYNAEKYLEQAIQSIISQSYQNWELIIVDDGSQDKSSDIYLNFVEKDKRVRAYYQKNSGVSSARNNAMTKITGDYVCFVDSDDWVGSDWLEKVLMNLKKDEDVDLIVFGWVFEFLNDKKIEKFEYKNMNNLEFRNYYIKKYNENKFPGFCCNKIYKREILEGIKFNEKFNIVEDEILNYEVYLRAKQIIVLSDVFYHYRQFGEESLTTRAKFCYRREMYEQSKNFNEIIKKFYKVWGVDKSLYEEEVSEKYISSMYDVIFNTANYCFDRDERKRNIRRVFSDKYLIESMKTFKIEKARIKSIKILYYLTKIKSVFVTVFIMKLLKKYGEAIKRG